MWFKVCVISVLLISLGRIGTTPPYTEEELAAVAMGIQSIGESLKYPQSTIDKVISMFIQDSGTVSRTKISEQTVLMIEGALYQTKKQRGLSGDMNRYDVKALLRKMEEMNSVDVTSWTEFDEEKLSILKQQIEEGFPQEVAEIVVNLTREINNKAQTAEQEAKFTVDWIKLLLDGCLASAASAD